MIPAINCCIPFNSDAGSIGSAWIKFKGKANVDNDNRTITKAEVKILLKQNKGNRSLLTVLWTPFTNINEFLNRKNTSKNK